MWYQNIGRMFFRLVTKYACDGQTDGQNYDPQDRASMAASRGKMRLLSIYSYPSDHARIGYIRCLKVKYSDAC